MPDRRRHRGAHPKDATCFTPQKLPLLRQAAADLAWLLDRGYPAKASLHLVGDRYSLIDRQRAAVQRATVGDGWRNRRLERCLELEALRGQRLLVDGYNVLLSIESALGGGVILLSRDGVCRDMASMRGHYKRVEETRAALELIGHHLENAGCEAVEWFLDRPISNSGRLKKRMLALATEMDWPWTVELSPSPDRELKARGEAGTIVATADGWILDQDLAWVNLARVIIESSVPNAWVVDLRTP